MQVAIIGAGPTGLVLAAALARRGHKATVVDRDPGPEPDGTWPRKGVMQFHHAHAVRAQMAQVLLAELPEAHRLWLAAGAEPLTVDTPAGPRLIATRSRRATLERAIRAAVEPLPRVRLVLGHVDRIARERGRAVGLIVAGELLPADLVVDAAGRSSRVTDDLPAADGIGAGTGCAYVDRQYQLLPGREPGPLMGPIAWQADLEGMQTILFPHERGIFSVLFVRDTSRPELKELRRDRVFEALAATIPGLAEWTDPDRARPLTAVLPGGQLRNHFRSQRTAEGRVRLPGLISIGDAICTTTPMFGRGLATSMMQVTELLRLVDAGADPVADPEGLAEAFDDWSVARMRPWVEDHLRNDADQLRRWQPGADSVDLSQPLPSERILAAGERDPVIGQEAAPAAAMVAGPEVVYALEPRARAVYETGWRPTPSPGPGAEEIRATIERALSDAAGR